MIGVVTGTTPNTNTAHDPKSSDVTPVFPDFEKLVQERRSIRIFEKTPVPAEVIEKCLDLALLAPNSSNLQPWEFHWVKTEPLRGKLVEACMSQAAAATAAELIVCVARRKTWRENCADMILQMTEQEKMGVRIPKAAWSYYRTLTPKMYEQGWFSVLGYIKRVIFFFIGLRRPMMREPTSNLEMRIWATKSTALACENLMLAARAFGYDSCPMEGIDSRRISKMLKLPRDAETVMVLGIGKRSSKGVTLPRIRGDRSRFVFKH